LNPFPPVGTSIDFGGEPEGEIGTDRHMREEKIVLKKDSHTTIGGGELGEVVLSQEDPPPSMEGVRKRPNEE
jgi:hypothetical protein